MKKVVLIDDDKLISLSWSLKAKKAGIELVSFTSVEDFLNNCSGLSLDTPIYVDSSLKDGLKGEVESEKISQLGFEEIYLATGFEAKDFDLTKLPWIKRVISKSPPF